MEHLPYRPPVVGDQVGEYRLVAELGRGGHARVFKAERAGRFHAIKFYSAGMRPYWRREVDILRCLHGVEHVVRLEDWGEWPQPRAGWLYLVLELVEGWTLEGYALSRNPSARAAGRLFLLLGRTLVEARRRGVLHRDLKRENILVRAAAGGPVLVDFGVGDLEGVSTLPRDGLPPGTAEYVSPEAWRYVGALKSGGARYEPGVGDEQWALDVNFYWLLTGRLPFGTRAHGRHVEDRGGPEATRTARAQPANPPGAGGGVHAVCSAPSSPLPQCSRRRGAAYRALSRCVRPGSARCGSPAARAPPSARPRPRPPTAPRAPRTS